MRKTLALMCIMLLLSACHGDPQPSATPYPTYTPLPTYTPYITPTPKPTAIPLPLLQGWQEAQVMRISDGDTIEVTINGQVYRVRYIGIDAPEEGEPCYEEATRFNAYLVTHLGKTIYLEKDVSETDQYGRLLRYVWIAGPDEYIMANAELVAMGYARAIAYPPDVKHQAFLTQMEQHARQAGFVACWATPTPTTTATPTATAKAATSTPTAPASCPQGCITPPPGCVIKGNISSSTGEKIYHMPGQRYYDQTTIDPEKGERWFCTEEEAIANGWRKSKR
ncbi:MAG: thermonuclease family protein [Chloroflexi bacterium]|nr:thermonuclease family protein [Chloroflexota bacterium]